MKFNLLIPVLFVILSVSFIFIRRFMKLTVLQAAVLSIVLSVVAYYALIMIVAPFIVFGINR